LFESYTHVPTKLKKSVSLWFLQPGTHEIEKIGIIMIPAAGYPRNWKNWYPIYKSNSGVSNSDVSFFFFSFHLFHTFWEKRPFTRVTTYNRLSFLFIYFTRFGKKGPFTRVTTYNRLSVFSFSFHLFHTFWEK
jgi:hypothetical protein